MSVYDLKTKKASAYGQTRSFALIGGQLDIIINRILKNDNLVKLLKYPTRDALTREVEQETRMSLIKDNHLTLVPFIPKEEEIKTYLIITFDNFVPTKTTQRAMDYVMTFDIVCHRELWTMNGSCPRPYLIMDELMKEFNMTKVDTWGAMRFQGATSLIMNENFMGFTMMFDLSAIATTTGEE
jgi:hypothetical protein